MADLIFLGGDIITVNDAQPQAEAVAVKDGKILAVGNIAEVTCHMTEETQVVDLQGKTLMPGLVEPHSHPSLASFMLYNFTDVGLSTHPTIDDVYRTIEEMAKKVPPGQWLLFRGYDALNQKGALDQPPFRPRLDKITTVHPIFLVPDHTHSVYCNSLALQLGGITKESVTAKGEIRKDENGELSGVLVEYPAYGPVLDAMQFPSKEIYLEQFQQQAKSYSSQGITTVADLGFAVGLPLPEGTSYLDDVITETNFTPIRYINYINRLDPRSNLRVKSLEPPIWKPEEKYSQIGIKLWADGSPYCCTMAVAEPYLDTPLLRNGLLVQAPCFGELNFHFEQLMELVREPAKLGHQIAVHAQGERAIDQILDVYEALLKEIPKSDHRYRMEHCGQITDKQLQRCKEIGVTVTFYIDHIYYFGKQLSETFIGEERASRWAPVTSAQKNNVHWSLHQDTPCTPCKPFLSMRTAVTRLVRQKAGEAEKVLGPEYRIGIDEAIKAWTIYAAWQLFHEDVIGSIEAGKFADLIILDKNPCKVEPHFLDSVKVLATYHNGQKVYNS